MNKPEYASCMSWRRSPLPEAPRRMERKPTVWPADRRNILHSRACRPSPQREPDIGTKESRERKALGSTFPAQISIYNDYNSQPRALAPSTAALAPSSSLRRILALPL